MYASSTALNLRGTCPRARECIYGNAWGGFCDFAERTGRTRLARHIGEDVDINNPCMEFKPRGQIIRTLTDEEAWEMYLQDKRYRRVDFATFKKILLRRGVEVLDRVEKEAEV